MPPEPAREEVMRGLAPMPASDTPSVPSVQRAYRRMAPVYDFVFGRVFEDGRRAAIATLAPRPRDRVLEVGVGTGITLRHWPAHTRVTGIDLCPEMLARAERARRRHRLDHVNLKLMNAQDMAFPADSFDKVAAMYVVSVTPDLPALLREIQRVCVPGGRICIVNHFAHPNGVMRRIERALSSSAAFLGFETALPLSAITERTSLRIREVRSVNWGGYWSLIDAENVK